MELQQAGYIELNTGLFINAAERKLWRAHDTHTFYPPPPPLPPSPLTPPSRMWDTPVGHSTPLQYQQNNKNHQGRQTYLRKSTVEVSGLDTPLAAPTPVRNGTMPSGPLDTPHARRCAQLPCTVTVLRSERLAMPERGAHRRSKSPGIRGINPTIVPTASSAMAAGSPAPARSPRLNVG